MTITVFGAGAIGGITGAALARAGHDVLLVDKAEDHVAAVNAGGLTIERRDGAYTVPVRAITPDKLGPGLDLVLLAVKSQDTPAALQVLVPRLAGPGAIVSMQNGLNEELIAAAVGERRTVGCLVNWAADWTAPGRIVHGGEGALVLGELDGRRSARVDALAKLLEVVAPTRVSDNILGYTWAKHVYGALLVATAVVDAHVYEVVERSPEVQRMLMALVMESMAVAEAAGIRLEPFDEYDPAVYLSRPHQDQDRDLARPRRAPARDRGRRTAGRHRDEGHALQPRHAPDRAAHRDDHRSGGGAPRDDLGQRRRARAPSLTREPRATSVGYPRLAGACGSTLRR